MRISDWSSDVCSSDLIAPLSRRGGGSGDRRGDRRLARRRGDQGPPLQIHADAPLRRCRRRPMTDFTDDSFSDDGGLQALWRGSEPAFAPLPLDEIKRQAGRFGDAIRRRNRSEEHTSELQSLLRISYAVFCLKKKK